MTFFGNKSSLSLLAFTPRIFWNIATIVVSVCSVMGSYATEPTREPVVTYGRYADFGRSFEVKIYPDRSMAYRGILNTKVMGEREFRISEAQYNKLIQGFDDANFWKMEPVIGSFVMSGYYSLVVTLNVDGKSKTVRGASFPIFWPQKLIALMGAIEDIFDLKRLLCPFEVNRPDGSSVELCQSILEAEQNALKGAK